MYVGVGVADQEDFWEHDKPEVAGLWGGGEAYRRHNDSGHHRDVPRHHTEVPAHSHQNTLPL